MLNAEEERWPVGLARLGHDVYYFETTSSWPYDPGRESHVGDSDYAVPYLERVVRGFGFEHRWAYRRSYGDKAWFGMSRAAAEDLLAHADAVINVTGSTRVAEEGLEAGRMIYLGTDPVAHEILFHRGEEDVRTIVAEHHDFATYGENIGTPACPVPALPGLRARTRQPILLDQWEAGPPSKPEFTTTSSTASSMIARAPRMCCRTCSCA